MSYFESDHKPLRMYRLQQYNFKLQFTLGRDNVVANLLSRSVPPDSTCAQVDSEEDLIQLPHSPLADTVSLKI